MYTDTERQDGDEFSCCGIAELCEVLEVEDKSEILAEIADHKNIAGCLIATTIYRNKGSTRRNQDYAKPEEALLGAGFINAAIFDNPNTGNTLRLWIRVIHPEGSLERK